MHFRHITFQEAKRASRTGDTSQVREIGHKLMIRGACWQIKPLITIASTLGDRGICAAFDADSMQEAAWNMAKLTGYRARHYVKECWTTSKFATLWIALCEQNPEQVPVMFGYDKGMLWDCIATMKESDLGRAKEIAVATQVGLGIPDAKSIGPLLAFASIHRKSQMWNGILNAIGIDRLAEITPFKILEQEEPAPVLAYLLAYGGVLGKQRIGNILTTVEKSPSLVNALALYRFHLCVAALQSANVAWLKQIRAWGRQNDWPSHPFKGTSLLGMGLLLREFSGTLNKKWNSLDALGAKTPQEMARALAEPIVFSTLMDYAGQLGDEHCFDVLTRANAIGVDLLSIKGPDGKDIVASMQEQNSLMANHIQALVDHHVLSNETPITHPSSTPRRRM